MNSTAPVTGAQTTTYNWVFQHPMSSPALTAEGKITCWQAPARKRLRASR